MIVMMVMVMVMGLLTVDFIVRCFGLADLLGNPMMMIFSWDGWILKRRVLNLCMEVVNLAASPLRVKKRRKAMVPGVKCVHFCLVLIFYTVSLFLLLIGVL